MKLEFHPGSRGVFGHMVARRTPASIALLLLVVSGLVAVTLWLVSPPPLAHAQSQAPGPVLHIFGIGGLLTADGTLWQYRPEKKQWLTIDEAFHEQGKQTQILPLPVRPEEIREMVTWGFLLTQSGECWLYDIDRNRWDVLSPPRK